MTTEAYRITLKEIVRGVDPATLGYKPVLRVEPGTSDTVLTRILPNEKKVTIALACDRENSESRIYTIDNEAILAKYGSGEQRRMLVVDDEQKDFPLKHIATLFPGTPPMFMQVEDDDGKTEWLMLRHV